MSIRDPGKLKRDEPVTADLNIDGPHSCAKYLGFATINEFFDFLDSPAFRPIYEQYEQWETQHNLLRVPLGPCLPLLDDFVKKDEKDWTLSDRKFVSAEDTPPYVKVLYILSLLVQVYLKNHNASPSHSIGQEFPLEFPQARWRKIWNVFIFCTKHDYFSPQSHSRIRSCSHLDDVIVKPSFMLRTLGKDCSESEVKEKDKGYHMTWENMAVNTQHELPEPAKIILLPSHCLQSYRSLHTWVTDHYGLLWKGVQVGRIEVRVEESSKELNKPEILESPWKTLVQHVREGRSMSFTLHTIPFWVMGNGGGTLVYKACNAPATRELDVLDDPGLEEELEPAKDSPKALSLKEVTQPELENMQAGEQQPGERPIKRRRTSASSPTPKKPRHNCEEPETPPIANEVDQRFK